MNSKHLEESEKIKEIISGLDSVTLERVSRKMTLSIESMINPQRRKPRKRVPRPQNPFILYRRNLLEELKSATENKKSPLNFSEVSRKAGLSWKKESSQVKNDYKEIAGLAKKFHHYRYPNYEYKPGHKKIKSLKSPKSPQSSYSPLPTLLPPIETMLSRYNCVCRYGRQ
jgi:hypothetical protein